MSVQIPESSSAAVSRRALLSGAGAASLSLVSGGLVTGGLVAGVGTPAAAAPAAALAALADVAPLPAGQPVRTAFAAADQLYARSLAIVAAMANDIDDSDTESRGFMGGGWWRNPNVAANARVQENVSTLSWFVANSRPWNPYHRDPALLSRLDAAIVHYLSLQQADGSFPEYSRTEHSLSATCFGLGYLAKTLRNLRQGDLLPARRGQLNTALQKAMGWLLNPANSTWTGPVYWANQVAGGLAGATVALQLTPVADLQAKLDSRMTFFGQNAQSPAGYFYEANGMDIAYNVEVMMPELAEIHVRTGSSVAAAMATRFADWFGYVMLREPGNVGYLTYSAASSRTEISGYDEVPDEPDETYFGSRLIAAAPRLAAFYTSQEDRAAARAGWAAAPGPAPALPKGDLNQPREMALLFYGDGLPSAAQKQAAIAQLPYLRSTEWAEVRRDTVVKQDYLFVRRPSYYVGGFFGTRPTTTMRTGTGFLWHPTAGTVVHGQQSDTGCWGTVTATGPDAATSLAADYQIGGTTWNGARTAPGGADVVIRYRRFDSAVSTDLTLARGAVTRAVRASSAATEQVPLVLLPSDIVTFANGVTVTYGASASATTTGLTIRRGGVLISITWDRAAPASVTATSRTYLRDQRRRIHVLRIAHSGQLTTRIAMQ
jgi:hypothetical protein